MINENNTFNVNQTKSIRLAYIYSRVSKITQSQQGSGISRQIDRGKKFVESLNQKAIEQQKHHLYEVADEMIVDRGLSAYLGRNTSENAGLGAFLQAARDGKIPAHSLLVVEAVDRISRLDPAEARVIFLELARHKIDIAIQRFNIVVYHDQKSDLGSDLLLTVGFHLAHMESQQKSDRIRATFDKKREEERKGGVRRTTICPDWMKISSCKTKFELIPEHADVMKRIFRIRIEEGIGSGLVAKRLNAEGIRNFRGRSWSSKLIEKYWKMEQCIGVFQPQTDDYSSGKRKKIPLGNPIADYYPAVVSKNEFTQVQASFGNHESGSKSNNCKNLFAGMLKCSICGGSLSYSKSNRGYPKLRCRNYLDSRGCTQGQKGSLNYLPVEQLLVDSLSCINYSQLNKDYDSNSGKGGLAELELKIKKQQQKVDELKNQLETITSSTAIAMLAQELDRSCLEIVKLKQEQDKYLSAGGKPDMSQVVGLNLNEQEDRRKYNNFISRFVQYVVVSESDCIVAFRGNLGCVQLYLDNRLDRLRERGYKVGKDIIESKFHKSQEHDTIDMIQVDLKEYAEKQNQLFSQLTEVPLPTNSDYLTSLKYSYNAQLNAGLCPSKKHITSIILRNGVLHKIV